MKTGELFLLGVEAHEGTHVVYRWELEDEDLIKTSKMFLQVYNHPGVYDVKVTASNRNNTVHSHGTVVVQDEIKGLKCVKDTIAVVPLEEVVIKWTINRGSLFHFLVYFMSYLVFHYLVPSMRLVVFITRTTC